MKKYQILLIDDDIDYCYKFTQRAQNHNLKIHSFYNLEEGVDFLQSHQQIKAVVLDEKCGLNPEQKRGTEKTNFVFHAMQQITGLEHDQDRILPFCVNAISTNDFIDDLHGIANVFKKNSDESNLFKHLRSIISRLPESFVEQEFEDIFDFFDDFFDENDYDIMLSLLLDKDKSDAKSIITNLSLLRRIEEKFFDVLCVNILGQQPEDYEQRGRSRTKNIIQSLYQKKIMPRIIKDLGFQIYTLASRLGNHNNVGNEYLPTQYFVSALVFDLLEIIIWSKKHLK